MKKSLVFISHIHEEKEIANAFKELIEQSFLGMIDVFVSSNEESIGMGQRWLDSITSALKEASVEILLCSPESVKRPWINFEAGAGWIRDISVIPLCHSGMTPANLPIPLNMLEAATANEISSLKLIFPVLANAIGSSVPNTDFTVFVEKVKEFEENYTFWKRCNDHFARLDSIHSELISSLKQSPKIIIDLKESDIIIIEELMTFFTPNNLLELHRRGNVKMTPMGTFYDFEIITKNNFANIINHPKFMF
jgi:TIR domain